MYQQVYFEDIVILITYMDLHQEVQASIQIIRQSQQRNQEGITSQSLIQSRIADKMWAKEHEARKCCYY